MTREGDRPGRRLPGRSEDDALGGAVSASMLPHGGVVPAAKRFGQPSSYSLSHAELAAHIRQLRRVGWQSWEIVTRFDFGRVTDAA